jgi:anti-sigma regulatory factor (Ser/Thr protein kinase)
MKPDTLVRVQENTDIASARRTAAQFAQKAGLGEEDLGALAIVVTEAAGNLIKHGRGGDLILRNVSGDSHPLIEIIAIDSGVGMANIARCFEDGYSTAGSPGTGLGALARLSKFHDLYSAPDKGTVLLAHVGARTANHADTVVEIGAINVPYPGEEVSGDAWAFDVSPRRIRLIVADGLGHGIFAAEASAAAIEFVNDERSPDPLAVVQNAHARLRSTRGGAIAIVDIDVAGRSLTFAGVGNVAGSIISPAQLRRQMVSINGTLGQEVRNPRQYQYPAEPGALVILHSDGLSTHWSLDKYPGLFQRHPSVIAGVLFRDFRRTRDDATVVVARIGSGHIGSKEP